MGEDKKERLDMTLDLKESTGRCIAFFCLALMTFGWVFSYDVPGALETDIMLLFNLNSYQFSYLYSIYSWPNIIMCFFSGFLVDKYFGLKVGTLIYGTILAMGLIVFAIGVMVKIYPVILLGRFIYGIGAESIAICSNAYVILMFKNVQMNMVFASVVTMASLGSSTVYLVAKPLESLLACFVSQQHALIITIILCSSSGLMCLLAAIVLALIPSPRDASTSSQEDNKVRLKDIISFPLEYWLLCFACNIYFIGIYTFLALSQNSLVRKYGLSVEAANYVTSSFNVLSALLTPLLGYIVDKQGRNLLVINISLALGAAAHAFLAFTRITPYVALSTLAVSYTTMMSSMWPTVLWSAKNNKTASIYGVFQGVMNVFMSAGALLSGYIEDKFGFTNLELFFFISILVCLALTMVVWILDKRKDNVLNLTTKQRKRLV